MFTQVLLLAATLAAAPVDDQPAYSPHELRDAIGDALRREATTKGGDHDQAVRDLVDVFKALQQDDQLPERERRQRVGQVRHRLRDVAELLERHTDAPRQPQPKAANRAAPGNAVLGQVLPAVGGQRRGGTAATVRNGQQPGTLPGETDQAQQLIDLIQSTIAPATWDINGGPGTIMYFSPAKVLVIRQTSEVHGRVRDLSGQLRRN
jgi:hypothetical protein